jgi:hypothetical protein
LMTTGHLIKFLMTTGHLIKFWTTTGHLIKFWIMSKCFPPFICTSNEIQIPTHDVSLAPYGQLYFPYTQAGRQIDRQTTGHF